MQEVVSTLAAVLSQLAPLSDERAVRCAGVEAASTKAQDSDREEVQAQRVSPLAPDATRLRPAPLRTTLAV